MNKSLTILIGNVLDGIHSHRDNDTLSQIAER